MIATQTQTCPRCEMLIRPGDLIVHRSHGWMHATCVSGGDEE